MNRSSGWFPPSQTVVLYSQLKAHFMSNNEGIDGQGSVLPICQQSRVDDLIDIHAQFPLKNRAYYKQYLPFIQ